MPCTEVCVALIKQECWFLILFYSLESTYDVISSFTHRCRDTVMDVPGIFNLRKKIIVIIMYYVYTVLLIFWEIMLVFPAIKANYYNYICKQLLYLFFDSWYDENLVMLMVLMALKYFYTYRINFISMILF